MPIVTAIRTAHSCQDALLAHEGILELVAVLWDFDLLPEGIQLKDPCRGTPSAHGIQYASDRF